jgi:hypothetical protein
MKKTLLIALVAVFTASPVLAGGNYRVQPHKSKETKECCKKSNGNSVVKGLVWVVKLPFRVVTATTVGVYELVADQDFDGFRKGYDII